MGKSKYEIMAEATTKLVESVDSGVTDRVSEKRFEAELSRIDKETEQEIKEIKATPINRDLLKKQAESDLESKKKHSARLTSVSIQRAEHDIGQAELDNSNRVKQAELDIKVQKDELEQIKETSKEMEKRTNLRAQQEYDKILSSVNNTEQTITFKIERAEQEAEIKKKEIEIKLESIKAKNESQQDKQKYIKNLYEDTKAIGLALGDNASK